MKVRAARIPVFGARRIAKFIIAVGGHFSNGVAVTTVEADGQACTLMFREGLPVALATISASAEGIDQIMWLMRPSKLTAITESVQCAATRLITQATRLVRYSLLTIASAESGT